MAITDGQQNAPSYSSTGFIESWQSPLFQAQFFAPYPFFLHHLANKTTDRRHC